jgi:hypothetical protein
MLRDFDVTCPRCAKYSSAAADSTSPAPREGRTDEYPEVEIDLEPPEPGAVVPPGAVAPRPRRAAYEQRREQGRAPLTRQAQVEKAMWSVIPGLALLLGCLAPWLGTAFYLVVAKLSGTDIPLFHLGIWTLLSGACIVWLAAMEYLTAGAPHGALVRHVCVVVAAAGVTAFPAYYLWFVPFRSMDYGWYICVAAVLVLVYRLPRDGRLPDNRVAAIGVSAWLAVGVAACLIGWHDYKPVAEAQAKLRQLGVPPAVSVPGAPSVPVLPVPPPVLPTLPEPKAYDVVCAINRWWTAPTLGESFAARNAESGKTWLVASVTVTSREKNQISISSDDFELVCTNRNVYSSRDLWVSDSRVSPFEAKLLQGGSATGDVVFEVAAGAQPQELRCKPASFW